MQLQPLRAYYAAIAEAVQITLVQAGPEYGYEFVNLSCLDDTLMIAFRWHETADSIFVCLVDLHPYVVNTYPVAIAETIISTNFLERLGAGWYQQAQTFSIGKLTFYSLT